MKHNLRIQEAPEEDGLLLVIIPEVRAELGIYPSVILPRDVVRQIAMCMIAWADGVLPGGRAT
jgi:hypothetical protein